MAGDVGQQFAVALDYMRSAILRCRGAKLARKVRIASGCRITLPRGLAVGARVVLETGVVIKLVSKEARLRLSDHVFVGKGVEFDVIGELSVGAGTLLAPGCFVTDHNHGTKPGINIWKQPCQYKPISIGQDVWIGAKAIILPGVSIGDGAIVGAGSVVTHSVASMTVVAGVPARFIRNR